MRALTDGLVRNALRAAVFNPLQDKALLPSLQTNSSKSRSSTVMKMRRFLSPRREMVRFRYMFVNTDDNTLLEMNIKINTFFKTSFLSALLYFI